MSYEEVHAEITKQSSTVKLAANDLIGLTFLIFKLTILDLNNR